ncbi:Phospholipase A2 [Eufriesea mexicana]|uniref:Phospholipase A2 n=1 Tax=Eufriesea mexicana TaxID=516756 RepID=A0A310SPJ3_9HYME|nr:Phospholipase A2 [Eufriesea mexicana]
MSGALIRLAKLRYDTLGFTDGLLLRAQNGESQVVKYTVEGAGFPIEGTDGPGAFDKTGQCSFDSPVIGMARASENSHSVISVAEILFEWTIHNEQSLTHRRFKRGVIHLYNMVVCATGCNPLAYKGYGCYCGFLGSGYVIDGIDRCCKMHDWCYDATECPMFSEYFVPYYWRCYHGYKPVCAVEHGNWGGSGSCAQRLCECDRSFAECLKRYPCPTTKAVCTSSPWRLVQNLFMIM